MTLEEVFDGNMANRKKLCKSVGAVLRRAHAEKRLTCGLLPAITLLERDPSMVLFCILPQSSKDSAQHIHMVLLQAFCYENGIHIIKVDSAEKVGEFVSNNNIAGQRVDCSCVLVHQPWASDEKTDLTPQEKELVRYCHNTFDVYPEPVIKLPAL